MLEKLISGQEVIRSMEERRIKQYARIRQKARKSVLKKLQKEARRCLRKGGGEGVISISATQLNNCNLYLPFEEESFENLLKTKGWEVCKEEAFSAEENGKVCYMIKPIRD